MIFREPVLFVLLLCILSVYAERERKSGIWGFLSNLIPGRRGSSDPVYDVFTAQGVSRTEVQKRLDAGREALVKGEVSTHVLGAVRDLATISPEHVETQAVLGQLYAHFGDLQLAQDHLYAAVKASNWTHVGSVVQLTDTLKRRGEGDLAVQVAQRALGTLVNQGTADDSTTAILSMAVGDVMESKAQYSGAAEWYQVAAEKVKSDVSYWVKASTITFPAEHIDVERAETVLQQGSTALKGHAGQDELLFQLGLLRHRTGRVSEAMEYYEQALALSPTHASSLGNLGVALVESGKTRDAFALYERAIASMSSNEAVRVQYATFLGKLGRHSAASRIAAEAMALFPEHEDVVAAAAATEQARVAHRTRVVETQGLVSNAVREGAWDDVLAVTTAYGGEPSEDPAWYFFARGMAYYLKGEYEAALQLCSTAALHMQDSHLVWGCAGVAAEKLGRFAHAMHFFEKALANMEEIGAKGESEASSTSTSTSTLPAMGFVLQPADIEHALLSTAFRADQVNVCLAHTASLLGIPPLTPEAGGAVILVLAFVDWSITGQHAESQHSLDVLAAIEADLRRRGRLQLPAHVTLLDILRRLQSEPRFLSLINNGYACLMAAEEAVWVEARGEASLALTQVTSASPDDSEPYSPPQGATGIIMLTTYHKSSQDEDDSATAALLANLMHPYIDRIVLLNKQEYDFGNMPGNEKIEQLLIDENQELLLGGIFHLANERFPGRTILVSPPATYYDASLERLVGANLTATAVALTRWGDVGGEATLSLASDAHDAWLFRTPMDSQVASHADVVLGTPSGDVARLLRRAGYDVVNPSFTVHAIQKGARAGRDRLLYEGDGASVLLSTKKRFV